MRALERLVAIELAKQVEVEKSEPIAPPVLGQNIRQAEVAGVQAGSERDTLFGSEVVTDVHHLAP